MIYQSRAKGWELLDTETAEKTFKVNYNVFDKQCPKYRTTKELTKTISHILESYFCFTILITAIK